MSNPADTLAARLAAKLDRDVRVVDAGTAPEPATDAAVVVVSAASPADVARLEASWTDAGWVAAWRGPSRPEAGPVLVLRGAADVAVDDLLAAGAFGLLLDPAVTGGEDERLDGVRIAIVTYELVGLTRTGGIGTAYTALAHALAEAGADVDVLFTGWADDGVDVTAVAARYADGGVRLVQLADPPEPSVVSASRHARRAHQALAWVREHGPFAAVHVPECAGHGAAIVTARAAGLLPGSPVVVGTHGPTRWVRELNGEAIDTEDLLLLDALERRSVEWGEIVVSPSAYLVDDLRGRGWSLPARTFVQQLVLPPAALEHGRRARPADERIDEVVFFGRLETRKGLPLFLDALDSLVGRIRGSDLRVTFLGRPALIDGRPADRLVDERRRGWPWPVEIVTGLDQPEALAYLTTPGRLIVVPSTGDNLPLTVLEAIALGVPLVTTTTGGIPEIVDARDHDRCVVAPQAGAVAAAIAAGLGAPPEPPRFAVAPDRSRSAHLRWHAALAAHAGDPATPKDVAPAAVVPLGGQVPAGAAHVLVTSPRHRLHDRAAQLLAQVAATTGARAVVFGTLDDDGALRPASGGPASLAVTGAPMGTGSALVRADALDAVPASEAELDALLCRWALEGAPPFVLPEALADELAPPPGRLQVTAPAGALPRELADLPAYASATTRERDDLAAALRRADARVVELEGFFTDARTKLERVEAQFARVDAERDLAERRLAGLQNRKVVRLALLLAAALRRVAARAGVR